MLPKVKLRKCIKCRKLKVLNSFVPRGQNKDKHICYQCKAPRIKLKYPVKLREQIKQQIKSIGCQICGYSKCIAALEFHHINRDTKNEQAMKSDRFLDEIRKCILVCSNCHREIESFNKRLDRTDIAHCQQVINLTIENLPTPRTN